MKDTLSNSFRDYFQSKFSSLPAFADVSFRSFFEDTIYTHPSVIFAVEKLTPLEPEIMGLFEADLIVRVSSQMTDTESQETPKALHKARVALIEDELYSLIETYPEFEDVHFHLIEWGESDSQISSEERLFSDVLSLKMVVQ